MPPELYGRHKTSLDSGGREQLEPDPPFCRAAVRHHRNPVYHKCLSWAELYASRRNYRRSFTACRVFAEAVSEKQERRLITAKKGDGKRNIFPHFP